MLSGTALSFLAPLVGVAFANYFVELLARDAVALCDRRQTAFFGGLHRFELPVDKRRVGSLPGKLIAAHGGNIIEGSARAAEQGGPFSGLRGFFTNLPAESFARAADIGVSPASLGAGYIVFFLYSCAIGVLALILAVIVARKQARADGAATPEPAPA